MIITLEMLNPPLPIPSKRCLSTHLHHGATEVIMCHFTIYSPNMYNVFNVVFEVVGGGSQPAGQVHKKKGVVYWNYPESNYW